MIDAKSANNFNLICHGLSDDHFAIYAPETAETASIICIEYGCKSLDLYTFNNANDITFIPLDCPCSEDAITACIDSWDINCKYNDEDDKYMYHSQFISATQCIGDNSICCGDITNSMHETGCSGYTHYICPPKVDCFIDCNNVSAINTTFNFSCNTHQSIINASNATLLTVLCYDGDIGSCHGLTVLCPEDAINADAINADATFCNISCNGKNGGCDSLCIDTQKTTEFTLDCNAKESCSNVVIVNDDIDGKWL